MQEFINAYFEAALWAEGLEGETFSQETEKTMVKDCKQFFAIAEPMIAGRYTQAGHDFWLTRNGHGAGFWETPDWPEAEGKALTALCDMFGTFDLYLGDDGLVDS